MTRIDWHELSRRAGPPFLAFVVLTWAWAWKSGATRPAPDLDPFLKRAWPGAQYTSLPGGAFEVRRGGQIVGYAAPGTASGYSGPLTLAIGTSPEGRIRSVAILEYGDTPDLMRGATKLLAALIEKGPADAFEVGRDVDAVTGATFSSQRPRPGRAGRGADGGRARDGPLGADPGARAARERPRSSWSCCSLPGPSAGTGRASAREPASFSARARSS